MPAACSAAVPAIRRLAPPESAVQTIRPSAVAAGNAGHDVDPGRVGVGADQGGLPGCRVDREDAHVPLVAAGHDEQRLAGLASHAAVTR